MSTSILGAGVAPFGISYAGYGIPATETSLNKITLIDDFGNPANVRLIDPVTKDYKFNDRGNLIGGNDIQQLVYLALFTIKNSSAVLTLGQSFSNIKVIGTYYQTLVTNEVNVALKALIDAKQIELISVVVNKIGSNKIKMDVKWKDLTTNTEQVSSI